MKKILVLLTSLVLCAASQLHADTLLSTGDFPNTNPSGSFTAGTDTVGTFYYNSLDPATFGPNGRVETGGNPGAYLSLAPYERGAIVALQNTAGFALTSVSFDYASTTNYSSFQLRIYGLTNGQTLSAEYNQTSPVELFRSGDSALPGTSGVWTPASFAVDNNTTFATAFSGADLSAYDVIAFKFAANFDNPGPHGIDNLLIQGTAVPEPASMLMLAGGLGVMVVLRRRRNV